MGFGRDGEVPPVSQQRRAVKRAHWQALAALCLAPALPLGFPLASSTHRMAALSAAQHWECQPQPAAAALALPKDPRRRLGSPRPIPCAPCITCSSCWYSSSCCCRSSTTASRPAARERVQRRSASGAPAAQLARRLTGAVAAACGCGNALFVVTLGATRCMEAPKQAIAREQSVSRKLCQDSRALSGRCRVCWL